MGERNSVSERWKSIHNYVVNRSRVKLNNNQDNNSLDNQSAFEEKENDNYYAPRTTYRGQKERVHSQKEMQTMGRGSPVGTRVLLSTHPDEYPSYPSQP